MAAVEACPVLWAPYGRRGGVAVPLSPVWPQWKRSRSPGPVWPPWGRGRSPGPHMAAVGAWPVPWAPCGGRGGVAGPLMPVWPPLGCGRPAGGRVAALEAWPVP